MNKIFRIAIEVPTGIIKASMNNMVYGSKISIKSAMSLFAEISIRRKGIVRIGAGF